MVNFIMAGYKDNLLGEANSFIEVLEQVSHLAPLDKPVLVIGERGTGKELIANSNSANRIGFRASKFIIIIFQLYFSNL